MGDPLLSARGFTIAGSYMPIANKFCDQHPEPFGFYVGTMHHERGKQLPAHLALTPTMYPIDRLWGFAPAVRLGRLIVSPGLDGLAPTKTVTAVFCFQRFVRMSVAHLPFSFDERTY